MSKKAVDKQTVKRNLMEFIRYVFVGGFAAVVDMAVNYVMLFYILGADKNDRGMVAISVAVGFILQCDP